MHSDLTNTFWDCARSSRRYPPVRFPRTTLGHHLASGRTSRNPAVRFPRTIPRHHTAFGRTNRSLQRPLLTLHATSCTGQPTLAQSVTPRLPLPQLPAARPRSKTLSVKCTRIMQSYELLSSHWPIRPVRTKLYFPASLRSPWKYYALYFAFELCQ